MGGWRVRSREVRPGRGERRTSAYANKEDLNRSSTPDGIAVSNTESEGSAAVRFPEAKIKEAILDPDPEIRDRATSYFAKSYSQDTSITAQVVKAVETHGRQDAC